jgi:hypothetical protein
MGRWRWVVAPHLPAALTQVVDKNRESRSAAIAGPELRIHSAINAILDNRVRLIAELAILGVLHLERNEHHDAKGDKPCYQPQRDRVCLAGF